MDHLIHVDYCSVFVNLVHRMEEVEDDANAVGSAQREDDETHFIIRVDRAYAVRSSVWRRLSVALGLSNNRPVTPSDGHRKRLPQSRASIGTVEQCWH